MRWVADSASSLWLNGQAHAFTHAALTICSQVQRQDHPPTAFHTPRQLRTLSSWAVVGIGVFSVLSAPKCTFGSEKATQLRSMREGPASVLAPSPLTYAAVEASRKLKLKPPPPSLLAVLFLFVILLVKLSYDMNRRIVRQNSHSHQNADRAAKSCVSAYLAGRPVARPDSLPSSTTQSSIEALRLLSNILCHDLTVFVCEGLLFLFGGECVPFMSIQMTILARVCLVIRAATNAKCQPFQTRNTPKPPKGFISLFLLHPVTIP